MKQLADKGKKERRLRQTLQNDRQNKSERRRHSQIGRNKRGQKIQLIQIAQDKIANSQFLNIVRLLTRTILTG